MHHQERSQSVGNRVQTKILEGEHLRMLKGAGCVYPEKGKSANAGPTEGTQLAMLCAEQGAKQMGDAASATMMVKTLGGARSSSSSQREATEPSAGRDESQRSEEDDERRLAGVRVPFLRELLATFHRISELPERITLDEERLYVGEALESLERMTTMLANTTTGGRYRRDPVAMMYMQRYRQPADLLAQNLSMVMTNPNNRR